VTEQLNALIAEYEAALHPKPTVESVCDACGKENGRGCFFDWARQGGDAFLVSTCPRLRTRMAEKRSKFTPHARG